MPQNEVPKTPLAPETLARLERDVQRLKHWVIVMLMIILLLAVKVFERRSRKQEYILVDGDGAPRAVMGVRDDTPFLSMFDRAGNTRIALSADDRGAPLLRLSNANATQHALLTVREHGAGLTLLDHQGSGIQLFTDPRDARIHFLDSDGWPRLGLGMDDGMPFLGFMATNLASRIIMGDAETGGRLSFFDRRGKRRLSLGVHQDRPFLNPVHDPDDDSDKE